jgi:hypothetical protein
LALLQLGHSKPKKDPSELLTKEKELNGLLDPSELLREEEEVDQGNPIRSPLEIQASGVGSKGEEVELEKGRFYTSGNPSLSCWLKRVRGDIGKAH